MIEQQLQIHLSTTEPEMPSKFNKPHGSHAVGVLKQSGQKRKENCVQKFHWMLTRLRFGTSSKPEAQPIAKTL
jgi:hypothetical protein